MDFLVTGAAGFIGMHTALRLLDRGDTVIGLETRMRSKVIVDGRNAHPLQMLRAEGWDDLSVGRLAGRNSRRPASP